MCKSPRENPRRKNPARGFSSFSSTKQINVSPLAEGTLSPRRKPPGVLGAKCALILTLTQNPDHNHSCRSFKISSGALKMRSLGVFWGYFDYPLGG